MTPENKVCFFEYINFKNAKMNAKILRMILLNLFLFSQLVLPIEITMVTVEHLDRKLDRYSVENYQLAPREFSIHVKTIFYF